MKTTTKRNRSKEKPWYCKWKTKDGRNTCNYISNTINIKMLTLPMKRQMFLNWTFLKIQIHIIFKKLYKTSLQRRIEIKTKEK